jgi:thiamine biosynthesis lipoprotein
LQRFEFKQYHMGVDVRLVLYARNQATAVAAGAAAYRRFAQLDDVMSDYRADSELMRLCAKAGGPPIRVSADLFRVLERAQDMARRSDGAFDVTVGPAVALWRTARKTKQLPGPEELKRAMALVGWRKLKLNARNRTAQLLVPGMKLDLGGIGKGYAADCAQQVLRRHGITRALVEAGGDIVVSGPPPGQSGWRIEVPNASAHGTPPTLSFANAAISTSGDTAQYVEIGGVRYSHIVDPRTGMGLTSRIAVTVVGRNGTTTDSLSTAISVLGAERGMALARTFPGVAVYIRRDEDAGADPQALLPIKHAALAPLCPHRLEPRVILRDWTHLHPSSAKRGVPSEPYFAYLAAEGRVLGAVPPLLQAGARQVAARVQHQV